MKGIIIFLIFTINIAYTQELNYLNQKKSQIHWNALKPYRWLDYNIWLKERKIKDKLPSWDIILQESNLKEVMGIVLECVNICRLYRGIHHSKARYLTRFKEGDEIETDAHSYAWIFLLDGTMIRLSPKTSIQLNEINISTSKNFIQVRINYGNLLWLSRLNSIFSQTTSRETDSIFLDLNMSEANHPKTEIKISEKIPKNIISSENVNIKKYKRLNKLIKENNKWIKNKPTYSFLVMPNGTVFGDNIQGEFIVIPNEKSFVKIRPPHMSRQKKTIKRKVKFYYRGFSNKTPFNLDNGIWYNIRADGRNIIELFSTKQFNISEFLTSNIPTIFIARELLLKKYSKFIFTELDEKKIAKNYGYRLWENNDKNDLKKRLKFLLQYTNLIETTNLTNITRFKDILKNTNRYYQKYSKDFYIKAIHDYYICKSCDKLIIKRENKSILNSTTKPYWNMINVKPTKIYTNSSK